MGGNTVLLVEHDIPLRLVLREFLEARGFAVLEASTGHEALTLVDQRRPDLVLLDLALPAEDGLVVTQELLQRAPEDGMRIAVFAGESLAGRRPEILAHISMGATHNLVTLERLERDLRLLFCRHGAGVPAEGGPAAAPGNTVLLVENDTQLRLVLRKFLEHRAFAVLEATTGAEALALAERHRPDVVLLDLGLPNEDGLVVAQELLRRAPAAGMPIAVFTSESLSGDRAEVLARISVGPSENLVALERLERDLRLLFSVKEHRTSRRFPRYPVAVPARCRRVASHRPHGHYAGGMVRTLSEGGLMIETNAPIPTASLLDVRLRMPGGEVGAAGRVVYSRFRTNATTGRAAYEHGVQFLEMGPEERRTLRRLISDAGATA